MANKTRKIQGDDTELTKNELNKLLYDYRLIENDRKAFNQEAKLVIQKQEQELNKLKTENENLMILFKLLNNPVFQRQDENLEEELKLLLNARQEINELIRCENEKKDELVKYLENLKDDVEILEKMRAEQLGVDRTKKNIFSVLDNSFISLKNITARYNSKIKENVLLRNDINHLKIEKKKNNDTLENLKTYLKEAEIELKYLADENKLTYEQRREGYTKIAALKERNDREERKFISELRELFRVIDHHDKLRGFMLQKVDSRVDIKNEIQSYISQCSPKMKEKVYSLKEYEKIFSQYDPRLLNANMRESKELFKNLLIELQNKDTQNFALFSHMYKLQINVDELKRSIDKFNKHLDDISIKQEENILKRQLSFDDKEILNLKLTEKFANFEELTKNDDNLLNMIYEKLKIIFEQLECNKDETYNKRLDNYEVTSLENIVYYLKFIEKRINQLISSFYYKKFKEDPHFNLRGSHNILYHRKKIRESLQLSYKQIEFDDTMDNNQTLSDNTKQHNISKNQQNHLMPIDTKDAFNALNLDLE